MAKHRFDGATFRVVLAEGT
ncbi:hypothetical protein ACFS27_19135 [Promicromonospora vindobonensis]|uniref:Uncharacterized protein n=1 Tax=Promicromonospora vindobonensis TaxID=195748 RepID=A0ABW5VZD5_9MICO